MNRQKQFHEILSFAKVFAKIREDTFWTKKNFEGFSQILKEQSGKKGIWVFTHPIAMI